MKPLDPMPGTGRQSTRMIIALIVLTTGIGPFTLNVPLPSMPSIAAEMGTSYDRVQLILTLFLLALALGQFIYGPLSDRFGRRPVLLAGLGVYIFGSAACAAASSLELLLAGRFVQGIGACVGMVLGRAMLADLYGRDRAASLIAYVTMAMVVAPMIAPAVGGFLDELVGWRASFAIVTAAGLILLGVTAARLPETHQNRSAAGGVVALLRGCRRLMVAPDFLAYTVVMTFASATFFSFLAGAPYVVVELMGRRPAEYGMWFAASAGSYMLGNFLSGRYAERVGSGRLMQTGCCLALLGMAVLIASISLAPPVPASLFLPMLLVGLGNGLVLPSAIASAVTVRPDLSGAASGLSGALQMGISAGATVLVAVNLEDTATPMAVVMAICATLSALGYLATRRFP